MANGVDTDDYELAWLDWIFKKTVMTNYGMSGTPNPNDLLMCLFTGDPRDNIAYPGMPAIGAVGSLEPSSAVYTGYARVAVPRTATEWLTATAAGVTTVKKATNDVVFPASTGGTGVVLTWCGVALEQPSIAFIRLLYAWPLVNPITVSTGIAPRIGVDDLIHEQL